MLRTIEYTLPCFYLYCIRGSGDHWVYLQIIFENMLTIDGHAIFHESSQLQKSQYCTSHVDHGRQILTRCSILWRRYRSYLKRGHGLSNSRTIKNLDCCWRYTFQVVQLTQRKLISPAGDYNSLLDGNTVTWSQCYWCRQFSSCLYWNTLSEICVHPPKDESDTHISTDWLCRC